MSRHVRRCCKERSAHFAHRSAVCFRRLHPRSPCPTGGTSKDADLQVCWFDADGRPGHQSATRYPVDVHDVWLLHVDGHVLRLGVPHDRRPGRRTLIDLGDHRAYRLHHRLHQRRFEVVLEAPRNGERAAGLPSVVRVDAMSLDATPIQVAYCTLAADKQDTELPSYLG